MQPQAGPEAVRWAASDSNRVRLRDLRTEEMVLNMGPQHPSTHGVLRLEVVTDGEIVVDVIPHIGYLHRCFEKHAESLTYPQVIPYVDRMDYLAAMNNELAWAIAVERLLGIEEEIHPRVQYIRVLMAELNRISSHLVSIGTFGQDAGAVTPFLWCFRDREHILNLFEWASGARLLYNYIWIGGLMHDLPLGFEERCREFVEYFRPKVRELNELLTYNKIFIERTANVGVLPVEVAVNWGCSGPMLRGSGLRWDLRRDDPYAVYPELDFEVCVGRGEIGTVGDSWNRYKVRAEEIEQSLRIVEQCLDQLQRGIGRRTADFDPQKLCPPRVAPPKDAEVYARFENPRGELGFYILSDGTDKPFRVKARAPSFSNLSVLPEISRGAMLADLIVILGSIDIVLGEVDR